jgi:hypothetical protein
MIGYQGGTFLKRSGVSKHITLHSNPEALNPLQCCIPQSLYIQLIVIMAVGSMALGAVEHIACIRSPVNINIRCHFY